MERIEHRSLRIVKESVVRRTDYRDEHNGSTMVMEEELDLTNAENRKALFARIIREIAGGMCASVEQLEEIRAGLCREINRTAEEYADEMPFH